MARVQSYNADFLKLCLNVGVQGRDRNYPYDRLEEGVAYYYNGMIMFMNLNYLYVTVYNELTSEMLKSMGYSVVRANDVWIPDLNTVDYVPTRIEKIVNNCFQLGFYNPEQIKDVVAKSDEIRMALAFQGDLCFYEPENLEFLVNRFKTHRNIRDIVNIIMANSPHFNKDRYIKEGFKENPSSTYVDSMVDNYSKSQTSGRGR